MRFGRLGLLRIHKILKIRAPAAPIGIFGSLPKTLRTCVNPPNWRTWELRRIVVIAGDSFHSFALSNLPSYFQLYGQWPFGNVRAAAPRPPNFDDARELRFVTRYYDLCENPEKSTMDLESLSATIIPGAQNTDNQCEITAPLTISSGCSSFYLAPPDENRYRKSRKSAPNV